MHGGCSMYHIADACMLPALQALAALTAALAFQRDWGLKSE